MPSQLRFLHSTVYIVLAKQRLTLEHSAMAVYAKKDEICLDQLGVVENLPAKPRNGLINQYSQLFNSGKSWKLVHGSYASGRSVSKQARAKS
jgi:hypothetical protein